MSKLIKQLRGNRKVIFDRGKFDDWCVYVVEINGRKRAPFDTEYFSDLKEIAKSYNTNKIYNDFTYIYHLTNKNIEQKVTELIDAIVLTYKKKDQVLIEQWLTVLYAGMIAEENKERAILKKRIKRLGMHQTLMLDFDPKIAANFSRGKKWKDLDVIMKPLGF